MQCGDHYYFAPLPAILTPLGNRSAHKVPANRPSARNLFISAADGIRPLN